MKTARRNSKRQPQFLTILVALWLLAVTTILSNTAQAAEAIWVFEDPTGERTYDEVMANPQWFEPTTDTSRGFSDSVFWVKETFTNPLSVASTQVVQFKSLRLPQVTEFLVTESGTRLRESGYLTPIAARPSTAHLTSFPLAIDPNATIELLYRVESQFKIDLDYQVLNTNSASRADNQAVMVGAMIFAALLMLLLYNLMLAVLNRAQLYLLYSGFLLASSFAVAAYFRLYEQLGLHVDSVLVEVYSGASAYAFAFLFLSHLFIENQTKTTKRLLTLGYLVLGVHLTFDPYTLVEFYAAVGGPIIFFVFTYLVVNAWIQKNPLARFVMLGWFGYTLSTAFYVANMYGIIGETFEYAVAIGNLFEGLVFSGVLAYRLRSLDRTETLLKSAEVELQRERLANELGYGYKWEFDLERQLIRPDKTFAAWHGKGWQAGEWYPAEEALHHIPEESRAAVAAARDNAIQEGRRSRRPFSTMHEMVRADTGARVWIQAHAKCLKLDGRDFLIGTSLDVTELVESKQAVDAEIEKFEGLSERATLLFWRLCLATKTVTYNRTFAKRWSLEPGGSIQFKDFASFMTPTFVKIFEESVDQVVSTKEPLERVVQAVAGPIQGQWHRMQFWPVFNEQAELIGVDFSNANINTLMQTQAELQSTITKQKELFAIVGHELRTPVSTIKMLTEDKELSEQERTQQIGDISESLLHVLEDMRVVISPERALESKTAPDNPFEVVSRSLNSVKSILEENGLSLTRHLMQGAYATYQIHGQALRQIVTNLVKNAAIHSGGTQILVSMEVTYLEQQASVRLRVEDNGKGIPVEQLETLYEAFARGDTSRDGSGLGLYIVKQLANRLHGSIAYTKSPLGGSCFTLNFPLGAEIAPSSKNLSEVSEVTLDGLRVLLAEDDNTLRMLTERMLIKKGAIVTACVNGREALDTFDPERFDLVVTDLMMPEMDGHQLTREIRATGATTRIVAVTAAVIGQETDQFMQEGADAVLSKPLRPEALVEVLAKVEAEGLV